MIVRLATIGLFLSLAILAVYTARHYLFTLSRLFGRHRQPYIDITVADWPLLTVLVPAHDEERVIAHALDALLASDYPSDRFVIVPIDDRSTDGTWAILEDYAARFPGRVRPYRRAGGSAPGKAAGLEEVGRTLGGEIHIVFDADYVPGPRLLRQLAAPFVDPEVGAVMGRVVPLNVGRSLLPRLLDLERSAGYQVDQQARMNLGLIPQYGGTVGGVRVAALRHVGGWRTDTLAEDTDMTLRLVLAGWEVVYQNRSECYEEVPETWASRERQIRRWAIGHTQAFVRHAGPMLRNRARLPWWAVLDGLLLLGVYLVPVVMLLGWACTLLLFYAGHAPGYLPVAFLVVSSFNTIGNFAAFFEVAAAVRLDGSRHRVRLLPLLFVGFLVSFAASLRATFSRSSWTRRPRPVQWDKTVRHRSPATAVGSLLAYDAGASSGTPDRRGASTASPLRGVTP
jgi:cellulose synthase/poly-beta-1,6-N-acetylglucosamine synthase-like glycosyltransferase